MPEVTYTAALIAGLVSFLSPCVLPLVPPYLVYLTGATLDDLTCAEANPSLVKRAVLLALVFVAGFSTVFIALGASASVIGQVVRVHSATLSMVAGVVIIVMGLHFVGLFRIPMLYRQAKLEHQPRSGPVGAYVMGLCFAFGWTPCIGPVLAAILAVAASETTVVKGATMLAAYSAGLGIPFIVAAVAIKPFLRFAAAVRHRLRMVEVVMGVLLVATGIAFLTGQMSSFAFWILETFPGLSKFG
ncbi:cytochrome c biogenesis protein CcdA [Phreatobacter aquaticus]|uniref:Cytochrome c biogenesis protein CcdA n=1 Tax=Phreatobacter aquaticus TaxID=2570229 RepID=A0A4D7QJY1_9HYPH|nr:cytochrome c biogenesis protein CcdA [Phreatobacter aquaticus]QCK87990.1 cytochrome c biogenesis protein CcdA [Phreatobacter aquaticus]